MKKEKSDEEYIASARRLALISLGISVTSLVGSILLLLLQISWIL